MLDTGKVRQIKSGCKNEVGAIIKLTRQIGNLANMLANWIKCQNFAWQAQDIGKFSQWHYTIDNVKKKKNKNLI